MQKLLAAAIVFCLSLPLLASPIVISPPNIEVSACVASTTGAHGWNGTCGCTTEGIVNPKFAERRSVDGDVMVLASPNSPNACTGSGSLFVYRKSGNEWLLETELLSPLRVPRDGFPGKVVVKDDTIVARSTSGPYATAIFKYNGSEWLEHQTIPADSTEDEGVDWNFDGTTISIMGLSNNSRIRFFSPSADGIWRQTSELPVGRDLGRDFPDILPANHALSGDTLVTRVIEEIDDIWRTHIQVFKKKELGWAEEFRYFIDNTSLSLGEFDPSPAVSTNEIIFRRYRLVRDSSGNWQRFSIEEVHPGGWYNMSPDGNILITATYFHDPAKPYEIRSYMLSDANKWELVDEISEPPLTGSEVRYMVNDGSTLLRRERIRTESNELEVRVFAYSFDENGIFIDAGQSETISEACDYSSANLYDGWGWNPITRMSCPPVVSGTGNVCLDTDGDGWGWNGVESCRVAPVSTNATSTDCIDEDGDGWGWNGVASCRVAQNATSGDCIDADGDGWGWNGVMSCEVRGSATQTEVLCVDSDGDGWGWDGVSSCRVN